MDIFPLRCLNLLLLAWDRHIPFSICLDFYIFAHLAPFSLLHLISLFHRSHPLVPPAHCHTKHLYLPNFKSYEVMTWPKEIFLLSQVVMCTSSVDLQAIPSWKISLQPTSMIALLTLMMVVRGHFVLRYIVPVNILSHDKLTQQHIVCLSFYLFILLSDPSKPGVRSMALDVTDSLTGVWLT